MNFNEKSLSLWWKFIAVIINSVLKIYHLDENQSLWLNSFVVMNIYNNDEIYHFDDWLLYRCDEIYHFSYWWGVHSDKDLLLWWNFIAVMQKK